MNESGIFGTNNTMQIDTTGTILQGRIKCVYQDLVHAFGTPINEDTQFVWLVIFNDFTVAKVLGPKNETESIYWDIYGFDEPAFIKTSTAVQRSLKEAA